MKYSSVLIVTYGRTGSTLLMGILNAIPGVLIRGENLNLCAGLHASFRALQKAKDSYGKVPRDSTQPFFGVDRFDEGLFIRKARDLLRSQLVPNDHDPVTCWGFKEIRYTPTALLESGAGVLQDYLDFLQLLMPEPAFIFLTRDHEQVTESAFWTNQDKNKTKSALAAFEMSAKRWSGSRDNCFWIDYSQIVQPSSQMNALFSFLGEKFDETRFHAVASREHSYSGKPENLLNVQRRGKQQSKPKAKAARGPVAMKGWQHVMRAAPGVAMVAIDAVDTAEGRIAGVVVCGAASRANWRLMVLANGREHQATWNIPSPRIGKEYPGTAGADRARFRVQLPELRGISGFDLILVDGSGHRQLLAECKLNTGHKS